MPTRSTQRRPSPTLRANLAPTLLSLALALALIACGPSRGGGGGGEDEDNNTSMSNNGSNNANNVGSNNGSSNNGSSNNGSSNNNNNNNNNVGGCDDDDDCDSGQVCQDGECTLSCAADDECAANEICLEDGCIRQGIGCRDDGDCDTDRFCEPRLSRCVEDNGDCRVDIFEPNENIGEAAEISAGDGPITDLTVCPGDNDYYLLELTAGQELEVTITFVHEVANLQLQLLSEMGEPIVRATSDTDNESFVFDVEFDGTYYLRVFAEELGQESAYALTFSSDVVTPTCEDDMYEPNNQFSRAAELEEGTIDATACSMNQDWYRISLFFGEFLDVVAVTDRTGLELALYDSNGTTELFRSANPGTVQTLDYFSDFGGDYFLQVVTNGDRDLDYALTVTFDINGNNTNIECDDEFEPNDNHGAASAIEPGTFDDLAVCDEDDYYAIELGPLDTITAAIFFSDAIGDIEMGFDDPNRLRLRTSASSSDNESITYTVERAGTYYVVVYPFLGASNSYRMEIDVEVGPEPPACEDAYEPNDTTSAPNTPAGAMVQGAVACEGDDDFYAINVTAPGSLIEVDVNWDDLFGDVDVDLLATDGATVLDSTGASPTAQRLEATADEAGTYFLRVVLDEGQNTSYDLSWTLLEPPSCASDFYESNDDRFSATPIDDPLDDLEAVACDDEDDWFAITTTEDVTDFEFTVTPLDPFGNVDVEVLDTDGVTVLETSATNGPESLLLHFAEAGTRYLRVFLREGGDPVRYELDVDFDDRSACYDLSEPNATFGEASDISPGSHGGLTLCERLDEEDFYTLFLGERDTLNISVSYNNIFGNVDLELIGADGETSLGISRSTSGMDSLSVEVPESGYYFIRAFVARSNSSITYSLDVDIEVFQPPMCEDDELEDDDTPAAARQVTPGIHMGQACYNDLDTFAILVPEGETLSADLSFTHRDGNLALDIFDSDGETLLRTSDTTTDREFLTWRVERTETLYVVVRTSGVAVNSYTLTLDTNEVAPTAECIDQFEPNQTREQAAPITTGVYTMLDVCPNEEDDDDWYAITATAGDMIVFGITFDDALADIDMRLYDSNGTTVLDSSTSTSDDELVEAIAPRTGTYYVEIFHFSGGRNIYDIDFELVTIEPPECDDDTLEDNDSAISARFLQPDRRYTAQACFADSDWVAVVAEADEAIVATLEFDNSAGNLNIFLYDQDGSTVLASSDTTWRSTETVSYTFTQPGLYYIEILAFGSDQNSYTFQYTLE